jgi:hypothetical protein
MFRHQARRHGLIRIAIVEGLDGNGNANSRYGYTVTWTSYNY